MADPDGGHRPLELDKPFDWDRFLQDYDRTQRGLPPLQLFRLGELMSAATKQQRAAIEAAAALRSVDQLSAAMSAASAVLHAQRAVVNQPVHLADP